MQTINILPDALINKIAAGEVIENPTSVVKELVENSIDAKAKNIHIEIKGSGFLSIKVEDDGIGMNKDDAIFCFERHATSKIKNFEDLIKVNSMGFRGEALSSIAAVSKVDLKTSQDTVATFVKIEGSKIIDISEVARTKGTTIEVKSLFYNTPVRKKFQKALSYINSELIKTIINLSLSQPNLGFSLNLNGKDEFVLPYNSDSKEIAFNKRVKELLSKEFLSSLDVNYEDNNIKIFGLIGSPNTCKKTRSCQFLIINDRVVTSSLISKLIKDAYATRISEDDFPIFSLNIKMPSSFIDVNVHPQKKEIRLTEIVYIKDAINKMIEKAFIIDKTNVSSKPFSEPTTFFENKLEFTQVDNQNISKPKENIFDKFEKQLLFENFSSNNHLFNDFIQINNFVLLDAFVYKSFLDLKDDDELLLVDLSNIYSYFLYEKILSKKPISKTQNFLVPQEVLLSLDDINFLEQNLDNFSNLGFEIRVLSKKSIAIDAIPEIVQKENLKDLLFLILEDFRNYDKTNLVDKIYEKRVAKEISIISKKKSYSKKEAIELLSIFINLKNIKFDFLGNPFFITFNRDKLEKLFKK